MSEVASFVAAHSGAKSDVEMSTIRTISWRLIPFLVLAYFFSYLDRVNLGFAALTMNADLKFSPLVFAWGAGIFFIGYVLFEVPSNLALEKFGASRCECRRKSLRSERIAQHERKRTMSCVWANWTRRQSPS